MDFKKQAAVFLIVAAAVFFMNPSSEADDNEIFGVVQETVEPNILLIIDNSGSMSSEMEIETGCWQECVDWECPGTWECTGWQIGNSCWLGDWVCCVDGSCGPENLVCSEYEEHCEYEITTRMAVAIQTVKDIIDQHAESNRFGIMTFHYQEGGYIPSYGGKVAACSVKDTFIMDENGNKKTGSEYDTAIENYKTYLKNVVEELEADGSTPLAETLFEAGRYFAEEDSVFNTDSSHYPYSGTYPDDDVAGYNPNVSHPPIGYRCRKNYIVLVTDGQPQLDHSIQGLSINGHTPSSSSYYPPEDESYYRHFYDTDEPELHDISALLYNNDINSKFDQEDFTQNVTTYTIGFSEGVSDKCQQLLQDTADRGTGAGDTPYDPDGGLFSYAEDEQALAQAFETIMFNIDEKATTFTTPTIPVNAVNKAYSGSYVYMSMFQPKSGQSRWIGNLKKYYLNNNGEICSCDTHEPILDSNDNIKDSASSCWTSPADDGGAVNKGGAGQILTNTLDEDRNIYSNIQGSFLNSQDNEFSKDNPNLEPGDFGFSTDSAKDSLIDSIRMAGEDWKLGDLNHSRPAVATYGSGDTAERYIFVGSNGGMLHCFDDTDGTEEWAFIPSEQFSRLEEAYTGDHSYFMDGSPTVAETSSNKKILLCGERRGGSHYYALDVTSYGSPEYLYTKTTEGQSWKKPQFTTVKTGSGQSEMQEAFLLTGGYDDSYDGGEDSPSNPAGNSVLLIEPETGEQIQRFDENDIPAMTHSIVSAFAADTLDDGKDTANLIYAGDLGGQILAFRDNNNPDSPQTLDGEWESFHLFTAESTGRKIFGEADFVPQIIDYWDEEQEVWKSTEGQYVYFGTGDRAHPLRTDTTNYFYCVKNDWKTEDITVSKTVSDFSTLKASGDIDPKVMVDVTDDLIQEGETHEIRQEAREKLEKKYNRGWYMELEGEGEKMLSTPLVFGGVIYFTTFMPGEGAETDDDPCTASGGGGTSRFYALNYKTGGAVYKNFDDNPEELSKTDRFTEINTSTSSISPSPTIIIRAPNEDTPRPPVLVTLGSSKTLSTGKTNLRIMYWRLN